MAMARGTEQDLTGAVAATLYWVELRTTLQAVLRERADRGDLKASEMLNFMNLVWQGPVPRQNEFVLNAQLVNNLSDLLSRALEGLHSLGNDPTQLIKEALVAGVLLPPHLLHGKTTGDDQQG